MPLAEKIGDLFSPERFENWSWGLADGMGMGDFFYDRGIPPQILTVSLLIIVGIAIFMVMPEPECGNGICSAGETYFNCKRDCERPLEQNVTVTISENAANQTYEVKAYNSDGVSVGTKTAKPAGSTSFSVLGEGGSVEVTTSDGQQWVAGIAPPGPEDDIPEESETGSGEEPGEDESGEQDADDSEDEEDGQELSFPDDFESPDGEDDIGDKLVALGMEACLDGYLAPGTSLEEAYLEYLDTILASIRVNGKPPEGIDAGCADINRDGFITDEDRLCFSATLDREYENLEECPDCTPWESGEICNDGLDNDCDGQVDKDNYDNEEGEDYILDGAVVDICDCNSLSPCGLTYSNWGLPVPTSEKNISRCSSIGGGPYRWHGFSERNCTPSRAGSTLVCNERSFNCTTNGTDWFWNGTNCLSYPDMSWTCEVCDENGVCDGIENFTICPEDCPSPALEALINLIDEAKPSGKATNETIRIMAGEAINSQMLLDSFSKLNALKFDCSGNICLEGNIDINPEELLPIEDIYLGASASCIGTETQFGCNITIKDPELGPALLLSRLVEDAIDSDQSTKTMVFSEGVVITMNDVLSHLGTNIDYLDLDCSSEFCTEDNFQLGGDSFAALDEIELPVKATCELLLNSKYGCRIIL